MTDAKFLQIHTLTSYPATLLNRDDAGFAKRLPFGGATRTRVSSQCLKYHWRHFKGEHSLYEELDVERSIRSRQTLLKKIVDPLLAQGYPASLTHGMTLTFKGLLLSDKKPTKTKYKNLLDPGDDDPREELKTGQITIFGEPEINYLKRLARETMDDLRDELGHLWDNPEATPSSDDFDVAYDKFKSISKGDLKKNLTGMKLATGLDAALFGRMATSDILARGDSALHVAHSFTTHEQASESDYFAAIDELTAEAGEMGSGHINSNELTSGLFYSYVVVDIPQLISNIEGCPRHKWRDEDPTLAAEVVERFVHLAATVTPGAKLGSTAPYAYAEMVLVEAGNAQPRTLANAFRKPVKEEPDVLENSFQALGGYISDLDGMYGHTNQRRLSARGPVQGLVDAVGVTSTTPVSESANWAADKLRGQQ